MSIDRRTLLGSAAALAPALLADGALARTRTAAKPNIIFIMADDLGYADVSCYGRRDYTTPAIDELARTGMRFVQGYANAAVCSSTRTALMTGRYQSRLEVGLEEPVGQRPEIGLPPSHPTLPGLLRDAGYQTALIGKWHLGRLPKFGPLLSGYDHFWGMREGSVDYFTHASLGNRADLWDGDTPITSAGYLTELMGDKSIEMLRMMAANNRPFFMSLHFSAPHWPWEGPNDQAESQRIAKDPRGILHYDGGSAKTYAEMVLAMDTQIGRLMAMLDKLRLTDNTIVVFTSDNGGERFSDNFPFTGIKTELLEGGIRTPFIVRWPGVSRPGFVSQQVIITMDMVPTLVAAGGGTLHPDFPSDGMDITAAIAGGAPSARKLHFRYKNMAQQAHRDGDWKYLKINDKSYLFNLADDPRERANLKGRYPEIYTRLAAAHQAWDATMLPIGPDVFTHGYSSDELADHFEPPR